MPVRRPVRPRHNSAESDFNVREREQAWRAVRNFNALLPQLRHFARSITGNPKVDIRATADNPQTMGGIIYIRPPMGLGKNHQHDRSVCGERGDNGKQRCYACHCREVIDFFLFHEIAHIAFGTQVEPSWNDKKLAIEHMDEWHPKGACNHRGLIESRISSAPDPQNVLGSLNKYLGMILNCLEDARVNSRTFEARPGLKKVFDTNLELVMTEGIEVGIDKYTRWIDVPLDSQFMVGLNILAEGHEVEGRLVPEVVEALNDSHLRELCDRAINAKDVHEILNLSLEVFRRAQELGFCVVEKCAIPEPEPETPPTLEDGCNGDSGPQGTEGDEGKPSEAPDGTGAGSEQADQASDDTVDGASDSSDSSGDAKETDDDTGAGSESSGDVHGSTGDGTSADNAERETSTGDSKSDSSSDEGGSPDSEGSGDEDDYKSSAAGRPLSDDGDDDSDGRGGSGGSDPAGNPQGSSEDNDQESEISNSSDAAGDGGAGDINEDEPDDNDGDASHAEPDGSETAGSVEGSDGGEDALGDDSSPEDPWSVEGPDATGAGFDVPTIDDGASTPSTLEHGTADDIEDVIGRFLMHGDDANPGILDKIADGDLKAILGQSGDETAQIGDIVRGLIKVALAQVRFFDDASMHVGGVEEITWPCLPIRWETEFDAKDFEPNETLVGAAILHSRRVFDDNAKGKNITNLKSGRVNTRVLGLRAGVGDERLFHKKARPGKRSYFVIIGIDCSGSTASYERNAKIKRAAMAQGEVLSRMGIPWAGYGHTAYTQPIAMWDRVPSDTYYVYMLPFKLEHEPWNATSKQKLANISPVSDNLDGHTLEYYRKLAERSNATDKIIIYYTDGEMPAANYHEELEVLQREVATCQRLGITLQGVGINTDSPTKYGMDTVRIDSDGDIRLVIKQLEKRLTGSR